jgi:thioredoxin 1
MVFTAQFSAHEPSRAFVDAMEGVVLVEFGAPWCPHCQRIQQSLAAVLAAHPEVRHLKVEDGRGQPLGRSFRIKLWPTLVLMQAGRERSRTVRPTTTEEIEQLFIA